MTGASGASSLTGGALPKWQLALAVGTPVALGLGYMYYRNSNKSTPKSNRGKLKSNSKENGKPATDKQISIDVDYPPKSTPKPETELEKAKRFKNEGNNHFRIGKYDEAIKQYTTAIEICPPENTEDLAIFYQNRAAAYEQLKKYNAVKSDCTKALELKPRYTKALLRRAQALEHCNNFESALEDVTAVCILENFSSQRSLEMTDRVLKRLGKQHAMEYLANKKYVMPSKHFVKSYINSFHNDPVFTLLKNSDNKNISPSFAKILESLKDEKYDDIIQLCIEELKNSEPDTLSYRMEVLLLRATFYLLIGQYESSIKDCDTIINSDIASKAVKVNAFVKRAISHMHLENSEKGFQDFNMAIELDPDCGDIYFHKGQANLLMEQIEKAREDFKKTVDLNPEFEEAYMQKCYADYHYGMITRDREISTEAVIGFEKALDKFPNCPDCYILYAQILSETQEFQKADSYLVKAIEKDPSNAEVYVHRGLLQLKWSGNVDKAIEYINHALKLDNKCEFGYETLAAIEVQRGNLERAIELFDEALVLARTTSELAHIFGLRDAAKTRLVLKDKLDPDILMNISTIS